MVEDTSKRRPRLRIGPSPTGDPHVGTAYIALFNYVLAKKLGGEFILRIEDTDQQRSQRGWEQMIFDALKWLGLSWSEGPDVGGPHGPYRQSERAEIYQTYTHKLIERGAAYPCFCTPERLEQLRLTQRQRGVAPGYDGACRKLNPTEADARMKAAEVHVVRLKVPQEGSIAFTDVLRGPLSFEAHQIDDQILQKSDGLPTYHLANVVDDHLMQITHVMRAEEWITSTPKHVLLYQGFGWELPEFIHMPLLRNADKTKISKRKNPVSLNYYKEAGFLPEVMLNYLAMMGWTMPDGREKFSVQDMVDNFDLSRISLGGPVFDVQKLTWLNGQYLREADALDVMKRWRQEALSDAKLAQIAPLVHERITKLEDISELTQFFFSGDVALDAQAEQDLLPKNKTAKEGVALFEEVLAFLDAQTELEASSLEAAMRALSEKLGMKTKEVFMPLRVAVTGRRATPPLFDTMVAIGKERCRRRIRAAMAVLKARKD